MCGGNKGLFLTNLVILFILFLSMISIVFEFKGSCFKFQTILIIVFLIAAVILMCGVATCKSWAWKGLLIFYGINAINLLVIYFKTYQFLDMILPMIVIGFGYMIALIKIEPEDDFEFEDYTEEPVIKEVKEINIRRKIKRNRNSCKAY